MRFNHLYNFISPVTGRILSDPDYVPVGDTQGIAIPSPILIDMRLDIINLRQDINILEQASYVIGSPNSKLPHAQVLNKLDNGYMFNTGGTVSTISSIPPASLSLTENHVFVGNSSNQAADVATIQVANLPDLNENKVWVGNSSKRPVEKDYPSSGAAPADATYILQTADADLPNAQALADLSSLPGILWSSTSGVISIAIPDIDYATPASVVSAIATANAYTDAVAITTLAAANAYTDAVAIVTLASAAAFTTAAIAALRLNDISADGDIDISGYRIINAGNPIDPQDLTTKYYVDTAISGVPGSVFITLTGGVTGSGFSTSPIVTTVVSVSPSAIVGYPGHNKAFLRGDGAWTDTLGGALGLGGTTPIVTLTLGGTDSNYAAGPHMHCITNLDAYPEFQLLAWTHNNIALSFDAYYNGTNWLSSHSGSNFQITKVSNQLQFNYKSGIAQGSTIAWTNSLILGASGVVTVPSTGQLSVLAATASSSNTTGCAVFSGGIGVTGQIYTTTGLRLADTNIYFRAGADVNHGLGWYGTGKTFAGAAVDGPVLFGFTGGALGALSSGAARILAWNSTSVSISPTTSSTSISTGALTCAGGVGIAGTLNSNLIASANGSVSAPSYTFTSNLNTGLYLIGSNEIGVSCAGTKIIDIFTSAVTYSANIITGTGKYIGIETSTPHAPLQFSNTLANRKIVLLETANNDNQVFGLGTALNTFVYQVDSTGSDHVFFAGTSSTTSQVLAKIKGTGGLDNASFKLTSVGNPINPNDATNKFYVDAAIAGVPTSITLIGNVTGSGSTGSPITTTLVLTLDQIPLAAANVNINTHKLINVVDPTNPQDASTKNYTDTRTITLTGGVTGSGALGTSISTTVASVSPSAIIGYPNNTTTFLRGDGSWTNVLSGKLGIGSTSNPAYTLDIAGIAKFAGSTLNNQLVALSEGYSQGGLGGGVVGTTKAMSANTTVVFDTTTVSSNSKGFYGSVFDGRYIYLVPNNNGSTSGQITRYDTAQSFTSGSSYNVFDTTTVNSNSKGFIGAVFDGNKYIYLVPNLNGQITRYDITQPFTSSSSYSVFDTTTVNINSNGFFGAVFDSRYIYLVPKVNGQITRYDTTQPFTSGSSYSVFDTTTVNINSNNFCGGVFDGKYIYLVPYNNGNSGQITRYDTTGSFTNGSSYSVFDTTTVNVNSKGFVGGVFDGKYIYLVPYNLNGSPIFSGQITRYDTTQPFTSGSSYSVFDTTTVNSNSKGFIGGVFDGRYIYLVPNLNGQITRYDTTQSFISSSSYSVFDTTTVSSNSLGFVGGIFDGKYIYLVPYQNYTTLVYLGQITRIDAYPGSLATSISCSQAPNGLSVGLYAGVSTPVMLSISGSDQNYVSGPHIQCQTSLDSYPEFQLLPWTHDNIALSFDAYYNGTNWLSSHSGSNFQIIKKVNALAFNYATGIAQGGTITWSTGMSLTSSSLNLNSNKITNLATPAASGDGANKGYVDSAVAGVPTSITLIGNVTGSGSTGSPITTTLVLTLDQIPLAAANVNINTHKLINVVDPTNPQDASTKNYTDTRTITLTGGVTGSNTLGNSIATTVAICPPSAITGYPSNTTTFLRGDGSWTNVLGGSLGIGGTTPPTRLYISGTDQSYAAGPHIQCTTSLDSYPEFQLLSWTHDNIALSFDAYFDGTNWLSSYSGSNFQIEKKGGALLFTYATGVAQGSTITWSTGMSFTGSTLNLNSNKITNLATPTASGDGVNKNYVDTRTITLTGGVTGSNTLGNSIATTVAICPPSAITGYPSNTTTFLRGDGSWTNVLTGNLNILGNIGVNDAAPGSKLSVVGNAQIGFSSATSAPSNGLAVSGNVGIGTTTANSALQFPHALNNRIITLYETTNNLHQFYGFGIGSSVLRYQVDATSANHIWYAATSGTASNELVRFTGTGNVGINDTAPATRLSVVGNAQIGFSSATSAPSNGLAVSGNVGIGLSIPVCPLQVNTGTAGIGNLIGVFGSSVDQRILLYDENTSINAGPKIFFNAGNYASIVGNSNIVLMPTSNVGINDTAPATRLSVVGNAQIGFSSATSAPSNGLAISGNLAIGTTTAPVRLSLNGTDSSYAAGPHIQCTTSADIYSQFQLLPFSHNNISINFDAYWNGSNWISSFLSSNFQITKLSDLLQFNYAKLVAQGSTISWLTAMLINTSGWVGIGTTPSFTLDVNGTTRVTKLIGNANTPTVSLGSAVGTGATSSVSGTALGGVLTVTTGSLGLSVGTIATFTVSAFPSSTYAVMFLGASSNAAGITIWASSLTATTFSLTTTSLMSASTTYKWNYMILT